MRQVTTWEISELRKIQAKFANLGIEWDAQYYWNQEEEQIYDLGCPDSGDRFALALLVEAAKSLNGIRHEEALMLLKEATREIKASIKYRTSIGLLRKEETADAE